MIRGQLKRQVNGILELNRRFKSDDFALETRKISNNQSSLALRYRFQPDYCFNAHIHQQQKSIKTSSGVEVTGNVISGWLCPGTMMERENIDTVGTKGLLIEIEAWLDRLQQELATVPIVRELELHTQQIEQLLQHTKTLPEEYFTVAEAEKLSARLDELENELCENLKVSTNREDIWRAKITSLEKDFNDLRSQMFSLTQRGWLGSLLVRFARWSADADNARVLKGGVQIAKSLLPGEPDPLT